MAKNKTKKVKQWCERTNATYRHNAYRPDVQKGPAAKEKELIHKLWEADRKNRKTEIKSMYIRCPLCNRRLKAKTIDIEPFSMNGEYVFELPAHKRLVKEK